MGSVRRKARSAATPAPTPSTRTRRPRAVSSSPVASVPRRVPAAPILPPHDDPSPATSSHGRRDATSPTRLLHSLLHSASPPIITVPTFFTPAECAAWRSYADATHMERLTCAPTRETAARQQWRVTVESPQLAARIFERLRPLLDGALVVGEGGDRSAVTSGDGGGRWDRVVSSAIGCAPNLRLYRYEVGDAFGRHVDESGEVPGGGVTALTVLIYLNGSGGGGGGCGDVDGAGAADGEGWGTVRGGPDGVPLVGGETVFYRGSYGNSVVLRYAPVAGALLAHAHGEACLPHEAAKVVAGVKYVLRTDVVVSL
ncbi:hypothetical protein MMPV_006834 [Pyropia vietnamensis]